VADIFADGNTRVAWVGAISNIASPTTTELNAGILLQSVITADGLMGFEATTAEVDTTSLASLMSSETHHACVPAARTSAATASAAAPPR